MGQLCSPFTAARYLLEVTLRRAHNDFRLTAFRAWTTVFEHSLQRKLAITSICSELETASARNRVPGCCFVISLVNETPFTLPVRQVLTWAAIMLILVWVYRREAIEILPADWLHPRTRCHKGNCWVFHLYSLSSHDDNLNEVVAHRKSHLADRRRFLFTNNKRRRDLSTSHYLETSLCIFPKTKQNFLYPYSLFSLPILVSLTTLLRWLNSARGQESACARQPHRATPQGRTAANLARARVL